MGGAALPAPAQASSASARPAARGLDVVARSSRPPRGRALRPRAAGAGGQPQQEVRQVLSTRQRGKMDPSDDRQFYALPRINVQHVDAGFRQGVEQLYRERLPAGAAVLDLCSSWVSHLPPEVQYSRVVGHGLNAAELGSNPRLDSFFVRNLNLEPDGWAFEDAAFDAVLCTVSVQYMQQPERVFAEVLRVLKPGGVCIVSFSNRMFGSKAINAWTGNTEFGRVSLVKSYFLAAGFPEAGLESLREAPAAGPGAAQQMGPLAAAARWVERALQLGSADPFYAVIGYKGQG